MSKNWFMQEFLFSLASGAAAIFLGLCMHFDCKGFAGIFFPNLQSPPLPSKGKWSTPKDRRSLSKKFFSSDLDDQVWFQYTRL